MNINFLKSVVVPTDFTTITISDYLDYVKTAKFENEINGFRNSKSLSKDEQDKMKRRIPAVTISGTFKDRVANANLKEHSGFICIDFDHVENINEFKAQLIKDKYTYAVLYSASGNGLATLVKIDSAKHLEAYNGLKSYYFKTYTQLIDKSCSNVSRFRFLSMDKDLFINEKSATFKDYVKEIKATKQINTVLTGQEFDEVINKIVGGGYDLTAGDYANYLLIGFALAEEFKEQGRQYFHAVCSQNSKYDHKNCDKQYTFCMRGNGSNKIRIGSFYYLCKQAGIELKSAQGKKLEAIAKMAKKGGRNKDSVIEVAIASGLDSNQAKEIANAVFDNNINLSMSEDSDLAICQTFLNSAHTLMYNVITNDIEDRRILINGKYKILDDMALNTMYLKFSELSDNKISFEFFCKVIYSEFTKYYNPFLEFFEKNKNIDRSTALIDEVALSIDTDTANAIKFFKHWGCGIIASIMGKSSPLVLVLAGEKQNTGKTEFFRRLLPTSLISYYSESKLDAGKDDDILMCKKIMIMDDEFGGKSKHESKRFKELTSKQSFSIRLPYGRTHKDMRRLAVLCGTTNDLNLISDPTGNRRIIPINVNGIDHAKYNSVNKDALFMSFFDLYNSDFNWQLSTEDIKLLNENSDEFQAINFECELILQYFDMPENGFGDYFTNTEIKIYIESLSKQKIFDTRKLGLELKNLGVEQKLLRIGSKVSRVYYLKKKNLSPFTTQNNEF